MGPNIPADAPPPIPPAVSSEEPEPEPTPLTDEERAQQEAKNGAFETLQRWHGSIMTNYVFNTSIMYDPFMPIDSVTRTPEVNTSKEDENRKKPMLQRLALNQFVLSAIIVASNPNETSALVDSGGRGYILKRGTLIGPNNGYVKEITNTRVVIEEPEVNYLGETRFRETVFSLESLTEEGIAMEE
jgi:Tfp pilus assembly protein PilP